MSLFSLLLQIDTAAATANAIATPQDEISLIYLLKEGGIMMIPLLLCSIILVYVFVERLSVIRKAGEIDGGFMPRIREKVTKGDLQGARTLARGTQGPVARMIDKGISRVGKPIDHIEKSMENAGKLEVYHMEKNLSVLSTIAGIAPMFGFLGTIAGMIILFFDIQHKGFSLESIAGGIYTKMVTSAVGLIIGLLAYIAHNYLNAQINKNVNKMETASVEFLDILQEPAH
ncbi:MotA/TolQ/ExbB proton channel family protein [Polluticoccus soli]|uniref:MotA/TolQ/ExbB proton channel family protein n=1 Tax=Polluticoccus soli TaxID=3034150 RepID=UPI0023E146BB|nr:MotA/TolQ/ExbB proton channel family protein [Flavipsychrobacter sp. JY13-12]